MLKSPTTKLLGTLDKILIQTGYTAKISTLKMSASRPLVAFRSRENRIDQTTCQEQLSDKMAIRSAFQYRIPKVKSTQVHVSVMSLQWMEREGGNFLSFVKILNNAPNKSILQTKFSDVIFENFWWTYQKRIFWTHLWPFVFTCAFVAQNFGMFFAEQRNVFLEDPFSWYGKFVPFLGMCFMFLFNNLVAEWVQLQEVGVYNYFTSFWNLVDLGIVILSTLFCMESYRQEENWFLDRNQMAIIAGATTILLLSKMTGFLRLFDKTAFYLRLIVDTIKGTKQFLGLWILAIMVFGFLPYYLNLVRLDKPIDDFVYKASTQVWTNSKTGDSYS